MRRQTQLKPEEIKAIIDKCEVCYLAMATNDGVPYVLPFNFAYVDGIIYLHSGPSGKKLDILKENNRVCVTFSTDHLLAHQSENVACSYGMKFRSVVADGKLGFITDYNAKVEVLNYIMKKYTGREFSYNAPAVNNVCVMKIDVHNITGKTYGY